MDLKNFEEILSDKTGGNKKFKTDEYLEQGLLPIIDQGKQFIAGYTNEEAAKANVKLPCIIFGDHTKIFKYVDFPFALGADGTKVLEMVNGANAKYLYYYLSQINLPGKDGYNRNFKYLKEVKIPLPDLKTQQEIAHVLEQADKARQQRKSANALTDEFLQSSFLSLFGDPVKNEKGWEVKRLEELGEWQSGGTPSRQIPQYFTGDIPWYSSGELNEMFVSRSNEYVTKEAIKNSNAKLLEPNTLLLGMYDTAALKSSITTTLSSCNQAIAASKLELGVVDIYYVYHAIQYGKDHFRSQQRGVRQKNLNLTMIRELKLPIPPLSLQQQFAAIVAEAEALRKKQRESEQELEQLFQSLLQKYFG